MTAHWTDRLNLRTKATIGVLLVTTAALITIAVVGVAQMRGLARADEQRTVTAMARAIGHASELAVMVRDQHELARLSGGFMRDEQIQLIAIFDDTGKLLSHEARSPAIWSDYLHGRMMESGVVLGEQAVEFSASDDEFTGDTLDGAGSVPHTAATSPATRKGVVGRVVIGLSTAPALLAQQQQGQVTLLTTGSAAVLSMVLVYLFVGTLTRRLSHLVTASEQMAQGDFSHRIDEGRRDEIGRLSGAYERMRQAVQHRDAELRGFNDTLQQQVHERTHSLEEALHAAQAADQAKSRFLATMSHEIRTPLNGVVGMVDLLRATALDENQQRYARIARSSSDALLAVINDILDFSKIEAGRMELEATEFDLSTIVEDLAQATAPAAARKGLEISCHIQSEIPAKVVGDPGRLRQIILNLINNAVKFTENGMIVVRAALVEKGSNGALLQFFVSDTGIGIPPARVSRLFQCFSQVDASTTRKYGGTGLGLAIAKRLAELMGGTIGVESEPGRGSTFWFTARLQLAGPADAAPQSPKIPGDLRHLRVLVVDDNEVNREILRQQLSSWKLEVHTAADGHAALDMLDEAALRGEAFNLAILDWHMPEMNGIELSRAIKAREALQHTAMIMLTSIEDQVHHSEMQAMGFSGYLTKPVRQSRLFDTIAEAMSGNTHETRRAEVEVPSAQADRAEHLRQRHLHVLLAEDNEVNQMVASEILTNAGCTCDIVDNGRSACEAAERKAYDLILMDCQMPEMDGFEATRAVRQREAQRPQDRHIPIIALTANAIKGDRELCLDAGMDEYVSKPIDPDVLLKTMELVIERWPRRTTAAAAVPGGLPAAPQAPAVAGSTASAAATDMAAPPGPAGTPSMPGTSKVLAAFLADPGATAQTPLTPEPPVGDPADIPMDVEALLTRCMKNADFAGKILTKFQERVAEDVLSLVQSIANRNFDQAARQAHSLKGSAANLSANGVRALASEIEQLSRSQDGRLAEESLQRLHLEVERCLDYIPKAIKELSSRKSQAPRV